MRASPFSLNKWYLDCVTEDGDLAIVYCAELSWRGVRLHLNSTLAGVRGEIHTSTSVSRFHITARDRSITADLPKLGVSGTWDAGCDAVERLVYEGEGGALHWNCLQPRSTVRLELPDRTMSGLGYAEQVVLTVPPWKLPLRQLRWGRFVSTNDALAWVDWKGGFEAAFAVQDGEETALDSVRDHEVATADATLRIEQGVELRSGTLASTILPGLPVLQKVLPRRLFSIKEHKSCSRGVLTTRGRVSTGWVIHEVVDWNV